MARHQAIVLKKTPIREHDQLVMCYTKEFGKQRYVAKSADLPSSKQGSHIDVLNLIEFGIVPGKHLSIIASAHAVDTFPALKTSLPRMAGAFFILECFDKLVFEGERDDKLWEFLSRALRGEVQWPGLREELITVLGYPKATVLSELNPGYFSSLQFLRKV